MNKIVEMKNTFFTLAMITALFTATIFTGCQSSDTDVKAAESELKDAKEDLAKAKKNAEETAKAEEWRAFKAESEIKIKTNELRIAELREKVKSSGKTIAGITEKRINELEQKNKNLKAKLDSYEKDQSNWETFKREFNHDAEALGQAFSNITVDNKK